MNNRRNLHVPYKTPLGTLENETENLLMTQ